MLDPATTTGRFAGVELSHPERVLFPGPCITKLDLARFYQSIERWVMPGLVDRPLSLLRCPRGAGNVCFFQKHPGSALSGEIPRVTIVEKTTHDSYMYVRQPADLIRMVQANVLELHIWGSRVHDLEHPDMMVFDLDPGPEVTWRDVVRGALTLRERLATLGLASFPRLTGSKGLHLLVPLIPSADWDVVKALSQAIARQHASDAPGQFTSNMAKARRHGKIFIDYLRNARGATAIASYSTRAREGASVAVPVSWKELTPAIASDHYSVITLPRRLNALRSDPWADFDAARRPLGRETQRAGAAAKRTTKGRRSR